VLARHTKELKRQKGKVKRENGKCKNDEIAALPPSLSFFAKATKEPATVGQAGSFRIETITHRMNRWAFELRSEG